MSQADSTYWKRKLAAFLHDPPHKPFRIAGHEDARISFFTEVGLNEEEFRQVFSRMDDHWAAAADRMIFPDAAKSRVSTDWIVDCMFHHPLGGGTLGFTHRPATVEKAEEELHSALQGVGLENQDYWETKWWKVWRLWPETAARKNAIFGYLPADTRMPHHSIWQHNGLVSAFSGCERPECSFLMFQIGPVQDFIKQARSTRDLWAGSFLLSYLIARAMFTVAKAIGPESIIYPQLRGVPMFDWLGFCTDGQFWNEELHSKYRSNGVREALLTPNLPNRFLALVPTGWESENGLNIGQLAAQAVRAAWQEIAITVRGAINERVGAANPGWDMFWDDQVTRFPVVDFVVHDWEKTGTVLEQAGQGIPPLHGGWDNHPLRQALAWAGEKIPAEHRDSRCFPSRENPALLWSLHYAAAEWKFAAVKNGRAFDAWGTVAEVEKDHLDGRNEVLGGENHDIFWNAMREASWGDEVPATLFKGRQEYGALTAIKRLFPYVWMRKTLDTEAPRFDSVIDVALESDSEGDNSYYAVLCMDGDDMGQWVSGGKTAKWKEILSGDEDDQNSPLGYFKAKWGNGWEDVRSPLNPSFHAAMSEALGNFGIYCAGQIVEAFHGQLVYAGGDDVLAMLPANQAVDCAQALQIVFRGINPRDCQPSPSRRVQDTLLELFDFPAPGFVLCKKGTGRNDHQRPNWPLMVMGPSSSASVGIAIGHVRSPMQDVIQAAREAERRAKQVEGKGALALRILKRSGEFCEVAARFDSGVWGVWDEMEELRGQTSGRMIYNYLQKLKPLLLTISNGKQAWEPGWEKDGMDLIAVAEADLMESFARQTEFKDAKEKARRIIRILASLNPGDFLHFWMCRAFLNRLDRTGRETND